jgi:hypothetical protein
MTETMHKRLLAAAVWVGVIGLLGWLLWPVAKLVLITLLPLALLIVGMTMMPVKMSPAIRIGASLGLFGAFVALRKTLAVTDTVRALLTLAVGVTPPVDTLETLSLVIALIWIAGQMLLVVVTDRSRSGVARPIEVTLAERGYNDLLRSMARGEFGTMLARWITAVRWSVFIIIGMGLMYRSESLHGFEEEILVRPAAFRSVQGPSNSVIVTLTTPDNNPKKYLRTALEVNARFRSGGAAVVCFPARGFLDSTAAVLKDSLEKSGAIVFDREQFNPLYAMMGRGWNLLRFRSTDYGWYNGSPVVHPSLLAASRYLGVPIRIPDEYRQFREAVKRGRWAGSIPPAGESVLGTVSVPRWNDGFSVVLRREGFISMSHATGESSQWNSFIFPANIERPDWDGPIIYKTFGSGTPRTSLPDSVWKFVAGRMVFVQWEDMGEHSFQGTASTNALIADMASRGMFVRESLSWYLPLSLAVLLLGVLLFPWSRPLLSCASLVAVAVGIVVLDAWIFREYLVVTRLIYPAFTAGLAAVVLPLVRASMRE